MISNIESTLNSNDESFSIICNNCLGGFIYQYYNLEYRTPTLGLFILAEDYIKFLSNIKYYLSKELEFIDPKDSIHYEEFKDVKMSIEFPIGRLYDIEIYFLHYKNKEEASEKWTRRVNKINWNDLIIILAENETCNYEIIKQFDALPFKNKVCFTKECYPEIKSSCSIEEMKNPKKLWDVETIIKHFNLTEFINNRIH
jgi:Exopolysaccharide biosynthesis protein